MLEHLAPGPRGKGEALLLPLAGEGVHHRQRLLKEDLLPLVPHITGIGHQPIVSGWQGRRQLQATIPYPLLQYESGLHDRRGAIQKLHIPDLAHVGQPLVQIRGNEFHPYKLARQIKLLIRLQINPLSQFPCENRLPRP